MTTGLDGAWRAPWEPAIRVRATSAGVDPQSLKPGRDVVLYVPPEHVDVLPFGVLLDDHLSADHRDAIDLEALEQLAAWRERRDSDLTLDGACLPHIWEVELLTDVFVPETRIVSGLLSALAQQPPRTAELYGLDVERAACLRALLEPLGIHVKSAESCPLPRYPHRPIRPPQRSMLIRVARKIPGILGVPQRVRGEVYVVPFRHLLGVIERLASSNDVKPVLDPAGYPPVPLGRLLRIAIRGGWVGYGGTLGRLRGRRTLSTALAASRRTVQAPNSLSGLLDRRALMLLQQRAAETVPRVQLLRKAFASGRLKIALLPSDIGAHVRCVVQAARDAGVPMVAVQHGFRNEPNSPDLTLVDTAAVWSEADRRYAADRTSARVVVTGNPGVADRDIARRHRPGGSATGHTIVLVEGPAPLSARFDERLPFHQVNCALRALAGARQETVATIRPHPSVRKPEVYAEFASRYPELEVHVNAETALTELLAEADLCLGVVSTATLQAAAAWVPVILLNVTGRTAPWPFDGSTDVPIATSSEQLAALIPEVLALNDVPGRAEMLAALGATGNAADDLIELIRLVAGEGMPVPAGSGQLRDW